MSGMPQTPGPPQRTPLWKRWTWRRIVNRISHYRHRWYHLYWLPQYKRDKRREGADWNRWLRNCEERLAAKADPVVPDYLLAAKELARWKEAMPDIEWDEIPDDTQRWYVADVIVIVDAALGKTKEDNNE